MKKHDYEELADAVAAYVDDHLGYNDDDTYKFEAESGGEYYQISARITFYNDVVDEGDYWHDGCCEYSAVVRCIHCYYVDDDGKESDLSREVEMAYYAKYKY